MCSLIYLFIYFFQVTANRLLASKQTIPHYYLTVDARVDKLVKYVSNLIVT